MIAVARTEASSGRLPLYVLADGAALPFAGAFDAVFSAATLHWIHDHEAVFSSVRGALRPGGRFVAQCGGRGNLARLLDRTGSLMRSDSYEAWFQGWRDPWYFADPDSTADRLAAAGFTEVRTGLEQAPVRFDTPGEFSEFVACVCLRHQLDRLPLDLRPRFMHDLTRAFTGDSPTFVLDYWRLNIEARRPAA
jgi:trans-aconitate 2-methyltransferase